jgi:hypothetical protein
MCHCALATPSLFHGQSLRFQLTNFRRPAQFAIPSRQLSASRDPAAARTLIEESLPKCPPSSVP